MTLKGFYVWRKNIIFAKFITAQKNLNHNMFILNPMLRQGLLDIQYMCYKMVDNSFVDLSENSNIWLFYFIENQVNNYIVSIRVCSLNRFGFFFRWIS